MSGTTNSHAELIFAQRLAGTGYVSGVPYRQKHPAFRRRSKTAKASRSRARRTRTYSKSKYRSKRSRSKANQIGR